MQFALYRKALLACLCMCASVGAVLTPSIVFAEEGEVIEEVIVTGSYIRGTPEDAELPVDVVTRQDMEDIGSPSIVELIRNLG
jgi:iron complex outermembrane receptor protein